MGFESESGVWRHIYLTGAAELRNNGPINPPISTLNPALLMSMYDEILFDFIAVRFMAENAADLEFTFYVVQTDRGTVYRVEYNGNGVLNGRAVKTPSAGIPVLTLDRATLVDLILHTDGYTLTKAIDEGKATVSFVDADTKSSSCCPPPVLMPANIQPVEYVSNLFDLIDISHTNFNLVLPR